MLSPDRVAAMRREHATTLHEAGVLAAVTQQAVDAKRSRLSAACCKLPAWRCGRPLLLA